MTLRQLEKTLDEWVYILIYNLKCIIKGDQKIPVISAASIIAKTRRDLFMIKLAKKYPQYDWKNNFGYGTKKHMLALNKYGITKYHRRTFRPVHNILLLKKKLPQ